MGQAVQPAGDVTDGQRLLLGFLPGRRPGVLHAGLAQTSAAHHQRRYERGMFEGGVDGDERAHRDADQHRRSREVEVVQQSGEVVGLTERPARVRGPAVASGVGRDDPVTVLDQAGNQVVELRVVGEPRVQQDQRPARAGPLVAIGEEAVLRREGVERGHGRCGPDGMHGLIHDNQGVITTPS